MSHVKSRLSIIIQRVEGLTGSGVGSHGFYVKFRWRGEKFKTEAKKKTAGGRVDFGPAYKFLLPYDRNSDSPVLTIELWTSAAFSHKKVAEATVDLTRISFGVQADNFQYPFTATGGKDLGPSPSLVLSLQLQAFDEQASRQEIQRRLQQHAEEQQQKAQIEAQQARLERQLLNGEVPASSSQSSAPPQPPNQPPPAYHPPPVNYYGNQQNYSHPPPAHPYANPPHSNPYCPPPQMACGGQSCPNGAPAGPPHMYPQGNGPYMANGYPSPPPGGGFQGGYGGPGPYGHPPQPPYGGWAAPQQPGCVVIPPEAPPPKVQQATLTPSGHWKEEDIKYIKNILPQCSRKEIEEALTEGKGDREKAVDILLKKLVAHAVEENGSQVHALEQQAEQAPEPQVSWTHYSTQPAAQYYGPVVPAQPQVMPPQHFGFTPAPMYAQVGKVPPSGEDCSTWYRRRKALLIGINYRGTRAELRGCVNDVYRMKNLLCSVYGFHDSSTTVVTLTDDNPDMLYRPTRNNILKAARWLTIDNRPGDSLFFHYSGHGGRQIDRSGIEEDGYDETILPLDFETAGQIVDDELHAFLVQPLQNGCRLTAVMDCCHSGTGLDLPFTWNTPKWRWDEEVNPFYVLGDVQMFSGCEDDQTSADLAGHEDRAPGGAMTTAFISVLTARPFGHSYPSLMQGLTDSMVARGLSQRPQLTSSQKFDFNRPFNLSDVIPNKNPVLGRQIRRRRKPLPPGADRGRLAGPGAADVMLLAGAGLATGLLVGSLLSD
ncbi:ice family protease p20 domain-containing protein [Cystoisospora suis]|uniref:Ice family protease p20 domain-containing protein n=1 Tax=Cystoisospora suis TaxID=483139 RepID=A0A2C6K2L7_9APIC|nr:ice family protease p20 domain-containing protein [Cystoisospora suis]